MPTRTVLPGSGFVQRKIRQGGHDPRKADGISATAWFCDPRKVRLEYLDGRIARTVTSRNIVIAAGPDTTRDPHIPFGGRHIANTPASEPRSEIADTLCHHLRQNRVTLRLGESVHLAVPGGAGNP